MILETLDVAAQQRCHADALDESIEVHLDTGLVAIAGGQDDPGAIGIDLQHGAHRAVELGVHQHDVFAVRDPVEDDAGGEVDGTGDLDQGIDRAGRAQQRGVVGDGRTSGVDRPFQGGDTVDGRDLLDAGFGKGAAPGVRMTVGDGDQAHPGDGVDDLVGDRPAHRAGADHANPQRLSRPLAFLQRAIHDDHAGAPTGTGPNSGQAASFSEMALTGSGRVMRSLGSL